VEKLHLLNILIIVFVGVQLLSVVISFLLYKSQNKDKLYLHAAWVSLGLFLFSTSDYLLGPASKFHPIFSFAFLLISSTNMTYILEKHYDVKVIKPIHIYVGAYLWAILTVLVLLGFIESFLLTSLPISIVMASPMLLVLNKIRLLVSSVKVSLQKIDICFMGVMTLWILHFFDYPFLRSMKELDFSIMMFSIGLILTYLTFVLLPIIIKNKIIFENQLQDKKDSLFEKAEHELVAKEKLASIGFLSAGLAHEVKNPLNIIYNGSILVKKLLENIIKNNTTESLSLSKRYEEIKELSTSIETSCQEVNSVLKKLLSLTTGSSDAEELADLRVLIKSCLDGIHNKYELKYGFNVRVKIEIEDLILLKLVKNDIKSVFENIIDNAFYAILIKFQKGDLDYVPKLYVKGNMEGKVIEIIIRDNGQGISPEDIDNIFEAFYSNKPAGEGHGLGLTVVNDIIQKHSGEVTVNSELNVFTEFKITLPSEIMS